MASSVESLIVRYQLTEEDVNKQITDKDIEFISMSMCGKWKSLYAHLDLKAIIAEDIDRLQVDEDQKRSKFFSTWKEKKGSEATYEKLIGALLTMECRGDAESVCMLLRPQQQVQPEEQQQQEQQQPQQQPAVEEQQQPEEEQQQPAEEEQQQPEEEQQQPGQAELQDPTGIAGEGV